MNPTISLTLDATLIETLNPTLEETLNQTLKNDPQDNSDSNVGTVIIAGFGIFFGIAIVSLAILHFVYNYFEQDVNKSNDEPEKPEEISI